MCIRNEYGLQIAEADAAEALAAHRAGRLPSVPILRVPDPPPESWPALARAGFVREPAWITWHAAAPATPEAYLETAYGVPFARQNRAAILASDRDFAVAAFEGDRLVGGCSCTEDPGQDTVRLCFSAYPTRCRRPAPGGTSW